MKSSVACIIETRIIPSIADIVRNHVEYSGFPVMFFHGAGNKEFVRKELEGMDVEFVNIGVYGLSESAYNRLLASTFFWKKMPCEKVLIFQHDSRLLRHGIEAFMEYDMVGANIYHMDGFNGGLSLRSKSKMLEIIECTPYEGLVNEDIWAYQRLKQIGAKLPTREVAQLFSVETVAGLGSFGCHAIERYLCKEMCDTITNQYK